NAAKLLFKHEIKLNEKGASMSQIPPPNSKHEDTKAPRHEEEDNGDFESRMPDSNSEAASPTQSKIQNPESKIDLDAPAPRTFLWDPIREVCHFLQIAKAALSRFIKELTGMSAIELVDSLKAKNVKARMRTVLFPALRALTPNPSPTRGEGGKRGSSPLSPCGRGAGGEGDTRMTLWKRLKDSRRNPEFHRATYAIELGFASHQRMYRACLLAHGKVPSQLEWELIDEFLSALQGSGARGQETDTADGSAKSHHSHSSHDSHEKDPVSVEEMPQCSARTV
ncbi:MAG TPA: hypothetical protein VEJ63_04695, partial [Planctomycetota bacterium]|nr:hypothetical protein [Planctomycetota bacterium]